MLRRLPVFNGACAQHGLGVLRGRLCLVISLFERTRLSASGRSMTLKSWWCWQIRRLAMKAAIAPRQWRRRVAEADSRVIPQDSALLNGFPHSFPCRYVAGAEDDFGRGGRLVSADHVNEQADTDSVENFRVLQQSPDLGTQGALPFRGRSTNCHPDTLAPGQLGDKITT